MICLKCGGNIWIDSNCDRCGVSYNDMIGSISHNEMLKLLKRLRKKMQNHENTDIEESLLAVELMNSSLLVPTALTEGGFVVMTAFYDEGHEFILAFTDKGEYERHKNQNYQLLAWPFDALLELVGKGMEGLAINVGIDGCMLEKEFLMKYFSDDLKS